MGVYTVKAASLKKEIPAKEPGRKDMKVLVLDLEGPAGPEKVEWFTVAATALPAAGSQIEGDVTDNPPYLPKFKKAQAFGAGFGGGGARAEDPKKSAAIKRMHAQKCAVEVLSMQVRAGVVSLDDAMVPKLTKLADWFCQDVDRYRDAA